MLRVRNITTYYGRIQILKGVSLHVDEGEIVALIGANGAGKTTLINAVSGLLKVVEGSVTLGDREIANVSPEKIVKAGLSQVPEGRLVFSPLTVEDNLPALEPGQGRYYVTAVTNQGQRRYGRKSNSGALTGRDPALLPACAK